MMLRMRRTAHYYKYKEAARALVHARLSYFNTHYGLPLRKVFIKNTKSRWGSCSAAGNININYKILFLPPALQDYLIVHELSHLAHFNHGPQFWAHVAHACPNYRACRAALRKI